MKMKTKVFEHINLMLEKYKKEAQGARSSDIYSIAKHVVFDLEQIKEDLKKEFSEKENND